MTEAEIRGFADFARKKLSNGGSDSLEQCLQLWRAEQDDAETLDCVRRGLKQANAGNTRSFADVDADFQKKYGAAVGP